jgi:hypothetical protein
VRWWQKSPTSRTRPGSPGIGGNGTPVRLDELIRATGPETLYLCGGADNQLELSDRFTQVFLLQIDEPTMLARLDARQDDEWGRAGDSREYIRRLLPGYQDRLRAFGAVVIDARQPLDQVVDAILCRALANPAAGQARTAPIACDATSGTGNLDWSGRRESNPHDQLGRCTATWPHAL